MTVCSNPIFRWRPVQRHFGLQRICPAGSANPLCPSKSISTHNILILNEGSQS